jgi:threonine/homoserine/homoserine lactone efflux protein
VDVGSAVVSFALVAGLLTITPGLDTALVLRSAVLRGQREAFVTALGINTGALLWGAGAAVGVSALLTASTLAYTAVRLLGAAYMTYLGGRLLITAIRPGKAPSAEPPLVVHSGGGWQAWRRGVLTNLLNPKIGAFYLAVLPQFIPEGSSPLAMGLLLAVVHDVLGIAWFALLILGAHRARGFLQRRSTERAVNGSTGAILIGFGVRLGVAR